MTEIAVAPRVQTFERKANGLVRVAGTLDVLVYNMKFVSTTRSTG